MLINSYRGLQFLSTVISIFHGKLVAGLKRSQEVCLPPAAGIFAGIHICSFAV